ncbi:BspA family leucine-rich repeat surface protein [Candidatus Saccharibacteria bacterium]|nr:MAG: BspA family leucine-rich repeat surface protein [Candidatus Saccharibacteria bacterium]
MFGYAQCLINQLGLGTLPVATDMAYMFQNAVRFNQAVGSWNTS